MNNNAEKKSYKSLFVILIIVGVLLLLGLAFLLIYPTVSADNSIKDTQPTQATEEKFATDIKFEYFDEPSAFVEYIEECTDFYFPDSYYTDHFLAISDNGGAVPFYEHDMIGSYICTVYLDNLPKDTLAEFEKQISKDDRFVETLGDLEILIDSSGGSHIYEYKMVYNIDTKEYNTLPDKAGEYSLVTVFYDCDLHIFTVERFNNKYWKLEKSAQ